MKSLDILVVDDCEEDREAITLTLGSAESDNYEINILEAEDEQGALAIIAEHSVDLLFLDYCLPGSEGLNVLETLLAVIPATVPILLMTGFGNETLASEALGKGAAEFFIKDISGRYLSTLKNRVDKFYSTIERYSVCGTNQSIIKGFIENTQDQVLIISETGVLTHISNSASSMLGLRIESGVELNVNYLSRDNKANEESTTLAEIVKELNAQSSPQPSQKLTLASFDEKSLLNVEVLSHTSFTNSFSEKQHVLFIRLIDELTP